VNRRMGAKNKIAPLLVIMIAFSIVIQTQPFLVGAVPAPGPLNGKFFDNIVILPMENLGICDVLQGNISYWHMSCGTSQPTYMPYTTGLAKNWALATHYNSTDYSGHGFSLKNYLALLSGQTWGCTADDPPNSSTCTMNAWNSTNSNLVDILPASLSWKAYMENMTSNCQTTKSNTYAARHNPFVYFNDIVGDPTRCGQVVPAGTNGSLDSSLLNDLNTASAPNLMWLTPNLCNQMHDICNGPGNQTDTGASCNYSSTYAQCLPVGDRYLQQLVPQILSSYTFTHQRAALFITFDEGATYCPNGTSTDDCLYSIWAGPTVKTNFSSSARYGHYSWLETIQDNWGLSCLANSCSAPVMSEFFVSARTIGQPSLVTSPNLNTQPFGYPWDGNGFYAQGRSWIFYLNYASCGSYGATNCLNYATSANSLAWSTYSLDVVSGSTPSVVTNGTHVFYARYGGVDSESGKDVMFRVGALNANGTIAWQPETVARGGIPDTFYYSFSMRISSLGQAFIAYQNADSSWGAGYPFVISSNGTDYSTWQQNTQVSPRSDQWRFSLAPLPNGQMYLLYWPYWGMLRGRLWTSGTWSAEEIVTPPETYVQNIAFAFSTGSNTTYAIWQERSSQKIQFASRNGSWGSPETVATSDTGNNPRWTASYDPLQGKWYITSYTSNLISQYSGTPGSWSLKTPLWTTQGGRSRMAIGSFYNSGQVNSSTSILGFFWMQRNGYEENENLMFANETMTLN
jgi:hypothetical protein